MMKSTDCTVKMIIALGIFGISQFELNPNTLLGLQSERVASYANWDLGLLRWNHLKVLKQVVYHALDLHQR